MAGIGFAIRALARTDSISSIIGAGAHAAIIAAGPWLFTIASLAIISVVVENQIGLEALGSFRAVVIYAFAISLVATAPVTIVATRLVADALWSKQTWRVRPLLFATFLIAAAASAGCVIVVCLVLAIPFGLALSLLSSTVTVALVWVALAFCGAVRDYWSVTAAFAAGLIVGVVCVVAGAVVTSEPVILVLGFSTGLMLTWLGLTLRVMATFPDPVTLGRGPASLTAALSALEGGSRSYRDLALGAMAGAGAVWIDKLVFWVSPVGESVSGGLIHAPLYDSAMFISSLVMIPSLASFVFRLETEFFERYQKYYGSIKNHGTLSEIETARLRLQWDSLETLVLITVAQVGLCAVLIMTAPMLVEALKLQFGQIAILRFGALAAVFHFIFIAATSFILFFDRRRSYLALQVLFLVANLGFSLATLALGRDYYGVGYFAACLVSSLAAYVLAVQTFERLNFLTFIGNNPSIRDQAFEARRHAAGDL